jgi:hypothetical protein
MEIQFLVQTTDITLAINQVPLVHRLLLMSK